MSRAPDDRRPPEARPIRLGARQEVHPLRLGSPVRRLEPAPPAAREPGGPAPTAARASDGETRAAAREPVGTARAARWDGAGLRVAREAAGFTAAGLAGRTRLPLATIEQIEDQRVEKLPRAYLKGFLSAIAKELRLDPREVTRSYLDAIRPPPPPAEEGEPPDRGPTD